MTAARPGTRIAQVELGLDAVQRGDLGRELAEARLGVRIGRLDLEAERRLRHHHREILGERAEHLAERREGGRRQEEALAVGVVERVVQRRRRDPPRAQALERSAVGVLGEPEQIERGQDATGALGVAGAAVVRGEQAVRGRVVDVAVEHLAQLADRARGVIDGVDLGERHAVARAVRIDVEDAAVRLDRRDARSPDASRMRASPRCSGTAAREPPCAIAACAASIRIASAWRWSPPSAARRASTSAGGA